MKDQRFDRSLVDALLRPPAPELPRVLSFPFFKRYEHDDRARSQEILEQRTTEFKRRRKELEPQFKALDEKERHGRCKSLSREICDSVTREVYARHERQLACRILWDQSERILSLLRSKGIHSPPDREKATIALTAFRTTVDLDAFPEVNRSSPLYIGPDRDSFRDHVGRPIVVGPCEFFDETQKELIVKFGHPFHSTVPHEPPYLSQAERRYDSPRKMSERLLGLNPDFWAAYVGGDKRFGHDVVFYEPEQRFYFFDLVAGCYLPTSEAKIRLWLDLVLQERAWGLPESVARLILNEFRTKTVFDEIFAKAHALLAADSSFFTGVSPKVRWREKEQTTARAKIDAAIARFVNEEIELSSDKVLVLADCLNRFEVYCQETDVHPLERKEAKYALQASIRDCRGSGLRNDLVLDGNYCVAGWRGLRLRRWPGVLPIDSGGDSSEASQKESAPSGNAASDLASQLETAEIRESGESVASVDTPATASNDSPADANQEVALAS